MPPQRILIVANKWWEADPLCGILTHAKARPSVFSNFNVLRYPVVRSIKTELGTERPPDPKPEPRIVFNCYDALVEVWCLEELVNPAESSSSSFEKVRVLPGAINYGAPPNLVIAFGTAGSRSDLHINGSVIIGRKVFIHDPLAKVNDRSDLWSPPNADEIIDSDIPPDLLNKLDEQQLFAAEARFLDCPVRPADAAVIIASDALVALGVVNILKPTDYVWADEEAVSMFLRDHSAGQIGSVDTTHGVIRCASRAPFMYVSAIPNSAGLFDYEVRSKFYSQTFVAAHNAALALAWLLPTFVMRLEG